MFTLRIATISDVGLGAHMSEVPHIRCEVLALALDRCAASIRYSVRQGHLPRPDTFIGSRSVEGWTIESLRRFDPLLSERCETIQRALSQTKPIRLIAA